MYVNIGHTGCDRQDVDEGADVAAGPELQRLKRKYKDSRFPPSIVTQRQEFIDKKRPRTTGPAARTRPPPTPAIDKRILLTLSVTITDPGVDLPLPTWNGLCSWLVPNTIQAAFGLERGNVEHNLHAQGVVRYWNMEDADDSPLGAPREGTAEFREDVFQQQKRDLYHPIQIFEDPDTAEPQPALVVQARNRAITAIQKSVDDDNMRGRRKQLD
eukprot:gene3167-13180_t